MVCKCGWVSPEPFCTVTDHPEHVESMLLDARTISTAEQLVDLPVRTVLKERFPSGNGAVWERWNCDEWVRLDSCEHKPDRVPFLSSDMLWHPDWTRP